MNQILLKTLVSHPRIREQFSSRNYFDFTWPIHIAWLDQSDQLDWQSAPVTIKICNRRNRTEVLMLDVIL